MKDNIVKTNNKKVIKLKLKRFRVSFFDFIDAVDEETAIDITLNYLAECVQYQDVTAFEFKEMRG